MTSILLSREAAERFGPRIARILGARDHRLLHLDSEPGPGSMYDIAVAFLSRDVTGRSTKLKLSDTMIRFFGMLERSPRLRWAHTHSAGADRPVWKPIRARGITMTTSAGAMAASVAVSAVGGIIALERRFPELMDAQRRRSWEPLLEERAPRDLEGQRALVVGMGPIGIEVARLLQALGMSVCGATRSPRPHAGFEEVVAYAQIARLLPAADWLVLACPLTEVTRGLVDARALALLPAGAHVVNVARGEVVVEDDLIAALRSGHLGGAWLDVFTLEPLPAESPLWTLPRVIVSPHSSGFSRGNYERAGEIFLDNLARFLEGRALRNEVTAR